MSAHDVRVTMLGGFGVIVDGIPLPDGGWRRRHAASLIKLLALSPGRRLHRERVLAALWPELDVAEAAPRLHKAAHYARRWLGGGDTLVLGSDVVALYPGRHVHVDAVEFEQRARSALAARDPVAAAAAADMCSGELLPDDLYDSWAEEPRERLHVLRLDVLRVAQRWEELAAADPADEQAHVALARALAERGDRPAALREFERLERALRQHLGVGLSPEAAQLRASLLQPRDEAPSGRSDSGLLGRDGELTWVRQVLARVRQGTGRVLFVGGPAGIGKTRFLSAVGREAAGARMRVGTGVAARIEGAWPYAPVLEALSDLCRRHPALLDGLDDLMRVELERALAGRQGDWNGQGAHQRLFVAAAELLRLAAAGTGAVLVVDDAHDADEASLRLLHFLARSTLTERVAVVLAHRPVPSGLLADIRDGLVARGHASTLELRPLAPEDALALARRHAPTVPDPTLQAVAAAAGGLPFRVVAGARAAAVDPDAPPRQVLLPAGLPPDLLRTLAAVAVLGSSFDTDEFVELTGLRDDQAYADLDAAVAARLLRRTERGFVFGHALQREALLERWTGPGGRRAAHVAAARALERLGRSPGRIGRHLVQAGETAAAVPWVLRAAETEAALGAYRDALATLEDVRSAATGEDAARLLALRADLLSVCGDLAALDAYREALAAASSPGDRARIRTRMARAATHRGDLETASLALEGLTTDGGPNDGELLVTQGIVALLRRDFPAADRAVAEAWHRLTHGDPVDTRLFEVVTLQGMLAHYRGEWFQRLRGELRLGVQRPDLAGALFDSHLCVAEFLLYGPTPYDEVLGLADELRRTAERAGVVRAVAFAGALRGEAALLKGDLDLAESELAESADLYHALDSPGGEAHSLQRLAEVHVHRGKPAKAGLLLQKALPLARWSIVPQCLLPRIYGTMIEAAPDVAAANAIVDRWEAGVGPEDLCPFCAIMLAVPAARASAEAGDLERGRRFLSLAETIEARWEGTAWEAALLEVRGMLARAEHDTVRANRLLTTAATLFDSSGQPLDAARCRATAGRPALVPAPRVASAHSRGVATATGSPSP
ncbi:ATP-binding protein [Blastococcus deserti]|uniref:ATP-binding protein n=1 Tax=Blastococcus deserti TaxID=2259033 RepID=A0ABW4XEX3_9ACTN